MKTTFFSVLLALLLATHITSPAAFASTLECKSDRGEKSRATLVFKGNTLTSAEVRKSGIKGFSTVVLTRANSTASVGRNSEQKYRYLKQDITVEGVRAQVSLSYKIEERGRKLSLEEALVGANTSVEGAPYGKLRFDFTVDGGFEDLGWTYFYYCEFTEHN